MANDQKSTDGHLPRQNHSKSPKILYILTQFMIYFAVSINIINSLHLLPLQVHAVAYVNARYIVQL